MAATGSHALPRNPQVRDTAGKMGKSLSDVAATRSGHDFSSMLAVDPIGRRLGGGGFVSSRIAEKMAVMALSWCWYLRSSASSLRAKRGVGGEQFAQPHEGADDVEAHLDGSGAVKMVAAMMAPCSVKANGGNRGSRCF
jgi:hypothetical protein